jgi:hypothetical protein
VHNRMPVGYLNSFRIKRRLRFIFYKFYRVLYFSVPLARVIYSTRLFDKTAT